VATTPTPTPAPSKYTNGMSDGKLAAMNGTIAAPATSTDPCVWVAGNCIPLSVLEANPYPVSVTLTVRLAGLPQNQRDALVMFLNAHVDASANGMSSGG